METAETKEKRSRSSNFTENEKSHLVNTIARFKHIVENKGTDKTTNYDKNATWDQITTEFNNTSPVYHYRSKKVIKRFYENKKKELRKKFADAKMEQKKTGGGLPPKPHIEPFEEVLLSVTNEKSVHGLDPPHGGDLTSEDETQPSNDVEIVYEFDSQVTDDNLQESFILSPSDMPSTWKKYKPGDLQKPKNSALRKTQKENNGLVINYSGHDAVPGFIRDRSPEALNKDEQQDKSNPTPTRKRLASDRRRPRVQVKALTSSDVAEKYNKLLDMRLDVAEYSKKQLEQEILQGKEKYLKEMALLELQILVEKERVNRLRRNDI